MAKPLRILHLEDSATDGELVEYVLRKAGISFICQRVESHDQYVRGLQEFNPSIILGDFKLPSFDGMQALVIAQELAPFTPFIFVTGSMGEDIAVETLKNGASDYIIKDRMTRLPTAIKQALLNKQLLVQQQHTDQQLRIAATAFESLEGMLITDANGIILQVNKSFAEITGYSVTEIIGLNLRVLSSWSTNTSLYADMWITVNETGKWQGEIWSRRRNGQDYPEMFTIAAVKNKQGLITHFVATINDISIRKQIENSLSASHHLLKTIIDNAPVRIFWKDKSLHYLGCNPAFAADAGVANVQAIIGKQDNQLNWIDQTDAHRLDDLEIINSGIAKLFYEELKTTANGGKVWLRTSKVPLQNEADEIIGILGIYENITEQKLAVERIHYLANFDALTGLPNRIQLNDHLKYALSLAKRSNGRLVVMFLDLDHFKDVNDTLGHNMGDIVLIELAKRLTTLLREEDTVTRLGGDEFILMLPGIDEQGASNVAQKILDSIVLPYQLDNYTLTLTASIGIAVFPEDGDDLDTLSKSADTAMYRAKHDGRNCYRFFTAQMQARLSRNLQLLNALREAINEGQLLVHYQPQISLSDGHIIGVEALLRWQHPEFGSVSPAEFIPIAEESGLIMEIGEWVLRKAVKQAKLWLMAGFKPIIMAVNLSVVQFRHLDLPDLVSRILEEEDFPAQYLELELTESMAMQSPIEAINMMDNLHGSGVLMSIDDFGTGYSSLAYLKKFKVYKLKIDQSFVRDICIDSEDKLIVTAIINLAKSLGLKTIAEGVETLEQQTYLHEQGCDEMQGYLFSKPITAEQVETLLTV